MTLQELHNQALQLSVNERWHLVQSLLNSLQQETLPPEMPGQHVNLIRSLDPWTQSLLGIVQLDHDDSTESYTDYLEEKYS